MQIELDPKKWKFNPHLLLGFLFGILFVVGLFWLSSQGGDEESASKNAQFWSQLGRFGKQGLALMGLALGTVFLDDYIAKLFSPTELVARVGAALRRRSLVQAAPPTSVPTRRPKTTVLRVGSPRGKFRARGLQGRAHSYTQRRFPSALQRRVREEQHLSHTIPGAVSPARARPQ